MVTACSRYRTATAPRFADPPDYALPSIARFSAIKGLPQFPDNCDENQTSQLKHDSYFPWLYHSLFFPLSPSPIRRRAPPSPNENSFVVISLTARTTMRFGRKALPWQGERARIHLFPLLTLLMTKADGSRSTGARTEAGTARMSASRKAAKRSRSRVGHIWQAHRDGHDLGSHACGHFDGKGWSKADWEREFSAFRAALAEAWKRAGKPEAEPEGWADFAKNGIKGFRAPYLSLSDGLVPALEAFGFSYDASLVTKGPGWPSFADGLPRFGLPLIPEGPSHRPVIGMDYNLFVRHSMGVENRKDSVRFEERTLAAFRNAFLKEYEGERIPLQLGFHFVEMNGGAYWRALDRFLSDLQQAGRRLVSYAEALPMIEVEERRRIAAF